jgi:tetratricopeptide (TPR) repeat protein
MSVLPMQSYQHFIDDIQSAVYSPNTADPDFLRDAAAQYAEACADANQRLRQVGQLLRRGLRSEALQLTEEEPNLLDFVGMLDFPELPTWRELLKQLGMAPPPALLIDLAADINQAYAEHQPLESLLKQHRLLAMARAPLAGRVRTLRQIRRLDPANVAWEEDQKILETARIKQMDREIDTVFRHGDLSALTAIKAEFDDDGWKITKPSSLQSKIDRSYKDLSVKMARAELESLEQPLNAAHMSFDFEKAIQIKCRWNEVAKTAGLKPDEPLAERAAPALEWLANQEQLQTERNKRQRAIAALEEAIEDSAPNDELSRLYEATLIFDEPIPQALKNSVDQRMAAHTLATRRYQRIRLTSLVAIVILAATSIAYVVVHQQRRATVAGVG